MTTTALAPTTPAPGNTLHTPLAGGLLSLRTTVRTDDLDGGQQA